VPTDIEPLLTVEEVATIYRVSPRTVENWMSRGVGPKWIQTPSGRRFTPQAVREALQLPAPQVA
jgi:DNA-binding transcriptional MerR regulator